MKRLLSLLVILLLVPCRKDNATDTTPIQNPGFLEEFFKDNQQFVIRKTINSDVSFENQYATHRGYVFKPLVDLKITEVGGRIAENGVYEFEIYRIAEDWTSKSNRILLDSVTITDTKNFNTRKFARK